MIKKSFFLIFTLVSITAGLQARDYSYNSYGCSNPCCDTYDCCENSCCFGGKFTVYGDYLYWRARRCHLDYAIPFEPVDGTYAIGNVYSVCPKYDSGFRVGGIYSCGDLDLEGRYTYFYSSSRDSITDLNHYLAGTWLIPVFTVVAQGSKIELAQADWDVNYNAADALVGYELDVGNCFDFRLIGGFKYLSINQNLNILYSDSTDPSNASNSYDHLHNDLDMDGYGLTFGFETYYRICNCFGIIGSFAYDVLASDFDRREIYRTTTDGGANFTIHENLHDECWRLVSGLNLSVGLRYDLCLCGCYDVFVAAGYEFHHYLNMDDFLNLQAISSLITFDRQTEGLGLDGLFVRLGIGF